MSDTKLILHRLFGENRQELISHIPHAAVLCTTVEDAGPSEVTLKIPMRDHLVGDPGRGVVFGGVITTLLDQAGGLSVMCSLKELVSIATIDLRIDYMKPATPGRDLLGHAHCFKTTRNVGFVRGVAYHDDRSDPFATFHSTFMLGANPMPPGVLEAWKDRGERQDAENEGGDPSAPMGGTGE